MISEIKHRGNVERRTSASRLSFAGVVCRFVCLSFPLTRQTWKLVSKLARRLVATFCFVAKMAAKRR